MNSTCTPQPLAQLYKRLLSSLSSGSVSASVASGGRRLWPRWSAGERVAGRAGTGARKMSTISLDGLVSWSRWLSISAIQSDITTALKQRMPKPAKVKAKPKRRPDLNSSIYSLMNSPVLFDPVRVPRNKIVLCHGLYGFDVRGPAFFPRLQLHYWSKVLDILRGKVGADVVVTGVPGTGSIRDRATLLHNVLSERVPNQSVNFIAHSMGGLDCRHLISTIQPTEYTPVSLTTVSTPHRGSSFMDWCSANIGIGSGEMEQSAKEAISEVAKKVGEKYVPPYTLSTPLLSRPNPNSSTAEQATSLAQSTLAQLATLPQSLTSLLLALLDSPAYANLTTHFLANSFNPQTPNLPNVKYFSVGARAPADMSVFHPLWLPKTILDAAEERHAGRTPEWGADEGRDARRWNGHDGLVSIASARWGEFLGVIEGVDHWELRGGSGVYSDSPSSPNSSAGWTEWAKSFGIWRDARDRETVVSQADGSEEGKQRAAVTAALDWVVNTVSSSHAANPGAPRDPVKVEERRLEEEKRNRGEGVPVFDLERFYVALCRKLYDEGL